MKPVHLEQMHKLTDGYRSWCGLLFGYHEDGFRGHERLNPNPEAMTCRSCAKAWASFLNKWPED